MCVAGKKPYFEDLRTAVCSAAEPAKIAVFVIYRNSTRVDLCSTQVMYFPADQGISVALSPRLPSVRRTPEGSFVLGTSTLYNQCITVDFKLKSRKLM